MSEEQLIKRAKKNKPSAYAELFQLYKRLWFGTCLRYLKQESDAEDALQNALIKIFTNLNQFDENKGSFKSWSSRIVVNENLMILRKKVKSFEHFESSEHQEFVDQNETPIDKLSAQELTDLITSLPPGYRTVFNLYAIEGFTHKEIAVQLDISEGTSKSQLYKARKMLQHKLEILI
jgi:RNA polymerase sigma factor (sigma-70 family)